MSTHICEEIVLKIITKRERESEECVKDYSTEKSEEHRLRD